MTEGNAPAVALSPANAMPTAEFPAWRRKDPNSDQKGEDAMEKRQDRKLTLSRETLRFLVARELEKAKGGLPEDYTRDYASCVYRVCTGQSL